MCKTALRLCGAVDVTAFPDGWHLLFRDLQAEVVWRDVAAWVASVESETRDAAGPKLRFGPAASSCVSAGRESERALAVRRPGRADPDGGRRRRRASMGGR